jgi:hypothetical protein
MTELKLASSAITQVLWVGLLIYGVFRHWRDKRDFRVRRSYIFTNPVVISCLLMIVLTKYFWVKTWIPTIVLFIWVGAIIQITRTRLYIR